MKNRSVFYGFDAYVGQIVGKTTVNFWADDPNNLNFDTSKLISVDLSQNPEACRQKKIAPEAVIVDDFHGFKLGGHTTIGPDYPLGGTVGGCWLEADYWNQLPAAIKPPRVPKWRECYAYEMTTIYYWDGPMKYRRFYGFNAEIHSEAAPYALVSIWPAGKSQSGCGPSGTVWIDLDKCAHPIESGLTDIWLGSATRRGCLYLDEGQVKLMPFDDGGSKHPPGEGADDFS